MPTINQLSSVDTLSSSDQIPVYSSSNGDARKASLNALLTFIDGSFSQSEFPVQFATPSATGFNVNVTDSGNNAWVIIQPAAGYAAGSITLPAVANCVDGQEIKVNCTQAVTTFTVNGNGATSVIGAPTTLAANGFFTMKYYSAYQAWYRLG